MMISIARVILFTQIITVVMLLFRSTIGLVLLFIHMGIDHVCSQNITVNISLFIHISVSLIPIIIIMVIVLMISTIVGILDLRRLFGSCLCMSLLLRCVFDDVIFLVGLVVAIVDVAVR